MIKYVYVKGRRRIKKLFSIWYLCINLFKIKIFVAMTKSKIHFQRQQLDSL